MKQENLSRRNALRGALAVGCGLWLPVVLSGCDSKKSASPTTGAPAGSPATKTEPAAPATGKKLTQVSVQYQAQPKGEQKCGLCSNYIAESNSCKLVDGPISSDGWCSLWTKKT
jgi:hypothetical protein